MRDELKTVQQMKGQQGEQSMPSSARDPKNLPLGSDVPVCDVLRSDLAVLQLYLQTKTG